HPACPPLARPAAHRKRDSQRGPIVASPAQPERAGDPSSCRSGIPASGHGRTGRRGSRVPADGRRVAAYQITSRVQSGRRPIGRRKLFEVRNTAASSSPATATAERLSPAEVRAMDAYWRAANYLSVGQIYLLDNPLLRESLRPEHVKPRLLGHWGTTPGLNFIYVHLNRVIRARDLNAMYVIGPGHGGPGIVANAYLEGTYSEVYSAVTSDADGMRRLFRQFSFPGGIPSHVAPE